MSKVLADVTVPDDSWQDLDMLPGIENGPVITMIILALIVGIIVMSAIAIMGHINKKKKTKQAEPNQTQANQTELDQTRVNQTELGQTELEQTKGDTSQGLANNDGNNDNQKIT